MEILYCKEEMMKETNIKLMCWVFKIRASTHARTHALSTAHEQRKEASTQQKTPYFVCVCTGKWMEKRWHAFNITLRARVYFCYSFKLSFISVRTCRWGKHTFLIWYTYNNCADTHQQFSRSHMHIVYNAKLFNIFIHLLDGSNNICNQSEDEKRDGKNTPSNFILEWNEKVENK